MIILNNVCFKHFVKSTSLFNSTGYFFEVEKTESEIGSEPHMSHSGWVIAQCCRFRTNMNPILNEYKKIEEEIEARICFFLQTFK